MLGSLFQEPEKARKDLEAFASANESRLYKLFKTCAEPETDLRTLLKARNEFLRRIEQSHTDLLETFTILLDNASFMIINHSSIPQLIKTLQKPGTGVQGEKRAEASYQLLKLMAKECPPMLKSHMAELGIVAFDKRNERLSEIGLMGMAAVVKFEPECAFDDR